MTLPTVSLVVLTFNRGEALRRSIIHNLGTAHYPVREIVWVDNGSSDPLVKVTMAPMAHVSVLHSTNRGVARGYNAGLALASSDYIAITGQDVLMPERWLETFVRYVTTVPNTAVACIYTKPIEEVRERITGSVEVVNGLPLVPALPFDRKMFSRETLRRVGYLREDFGLYGWEDVEWGERAVRVSKRDGLRCYAIPDAKAEHLGSEGIFAFQQASMDDEGYHAFKQCEVNSDRKRALLQRIREEGHPYYTPF